MSYATEYKCPTCGAPLFFDPSAQTVHCENCGNDFTVEAVQALANADLGDSEFDWGDYTHTVDFSDTMDDMIVYQCKSCGALIEADKNTAATKCPYCDNNVVITDRVSGGLRPNAIIPFKISKDQLPKAFENFYVDKKLLPKDFFSRKVMERAQGVYVPFWLFSAVMDGSVTMNAQRSRTFREGDYQVTETDHYLLERSGHMTFIDVPVDASVKMDNDLMDSVEPFDFSQLVPFDPAYLTGYVADRFDSAPDDELYRANARMKKSATAAMAGTAGSFSDTSIRSNTIKITDPSVRYVFLPVYVLNCEYAGKKYRYAVNGQTGKVVGELPSSRRQGFKYFIKTAAITFVAITLLGWFAFGGRL